MAYEPSPAVQIISPSDPSAITNAAYKMAGLGSTGPWTVTPQTTGRILIIASGTITSGGAATCTLQLSYGTGVAPSNGAAVAGTQTGGQMAVVSDAGTLQFPFCMSTIVTGQTVPSIAGTGKAQVAAVPVWFDIAQKSSASTLQLQFLNLVAIEI